MLNQKIPTFVINLDRDSDRMIQVQRDLKPVLCLGVERVQAILGADLPAAVRFMLVRHKLWVERKGDIGCFISHVKAWERVATEQDWCLVLEDDIEPSGLDRLAGLKPPKDAELVFINNRMCPSPADDRAILNFLAITEGLRHLNETKKAPGGDGYLLTPGGARKLLDAVRGDSCFGHVDWRLLRYGVPRAALEGELADSWCAKVLINHLKRPFEPPFGLLKAYCLDVPLVLFTLGHASTRLAVTSR